MEMIEQIISNFKISGTLIGAKPFGNGHINDTFLVTFNTNGFAKKYIFRKINKYVFKNPKIVIDNTVKVTKHITNKLIDSGDENISSHVLKLIETKESSYFYLDENDNYWCSMVFIDDAYTVDYVETTEQAFQAAKAFGKFQKQLIDANISDYKESIPNFHNLENRLSAFDSACKRDEFARVKNITAEIRSVEKFRFLSNKITNLLESRVLPIRITHNDTKINNVMLNKKTNHGECVIDLDTVMPGTVLYDFGDMVRTSTSPVEEDEKDISKVHIRLDFFESLVKGYLGELADVLDDVEISNLVYGAKVIVLEQAIRFLTDYILNDVYYSTSYSEHNLIRAKNQFALLNSIELHSDEMEKIVKKFS